MRRRRFFINGMVVWGLLLATAALVGVSAARGDDFRIDNSAVVVGEKDPPSESTTIFCNGVVYDCMKSPAETVVFERAAGRFVLLNMKSRTRAELTTGELAAFSNRLQQLAARNSDPVLKFLAAPKFQERFDEATQELTLSSPWVTYRATLMPEADPAAIEQYHEFSDWYARLNTLLSPGSRPPFARLMLNAALAQRKAMPSQVMLTLAPSKSNRTPITVESTHQIVRPLKPSDLDRVAQIRESMGKYKLVGFEHYRKADLR